MSFEDGQDDSQTAVKITQPVTSTPKQSNFSGCKHCDSAGIIEELSSALSKLAEEVQQLKLRLSLREVRVSTSTVETQTVQVHQKCKGTDVQGLVSAKSLRNRSQSTQCQMQVSQPNVQEASSNTERRSVVEAGVGTDSVSLTESRRERGQTTNTVNPRLRERESCIASDDPVPGEATLIIGSSILQRIRTKGLEKNVHVRTNRGAQLQRIRKCIERTDVRKYRSIIIQAGGNDVANNREPEAIENDLISIIQDVKERSPKSVVFIAEITPRVDADVSFMNEIINYLCEEYGAKCIRVSENLRLCSNIYWKDQIHLSDRGTALLLKTYNQHVEILKQRSYNRTNKPCFNCAEEGHISRNCRHGGKVECWNCGGYGHKAKFCHY